MNDDLVIASTGGDIDLQSPDVLLGDEELLGTEDAS